MSAQRRTELLAVVSLLCVFSVVAGPEFVITVGGDSFDHPSSLIQTVDGGYAIAGYTNSFGPREGFLTKLDSLANHVWTRVLTLGVFEHICSIVQTADGGYVVAGVSSTVGSYATFVAKFDHLGSHQWTRLLDSHWTECLICAHDGGYVLAGYTWTTGTTSVLLSKLDSIGNHEWTRGLSGGVDDRAYSLVQSSDRGYLIMGVTESFGAGQYSILLAKFSSSGQYEWTRVLGGTGNDWGNWVVGTTDGGYAVAACTWSYGAGGALVSKLDSSGNHEWTRVLSGGVDDRAYRVVQGSDNGYVIVGGTWSFGHDDFLVAEFDLQGRCLWARVMNVADQDSATALVVTRDGGFAIGGRSWSWSLDQWNTVVAKLDSTGNSCLGYFVNPSVDTVVPLIETVEPLIWPVVPTMADTSPTIISPEPTIVVVCTGSYACGDCNGDDNVTIADATYIVGYIYRDGPALIGQGDVNLDTRITIADAAYIVGHIYRGGPPPCEPLVTSPARQKRRAER